MLFITQHGTDGKKTVVRSHDIITAKRICKYWENNREGNVSLIHNTGISNETVERIKRGGENNQS